MWFEDLTCNSKEERAFIFDTSWVLSRVFKSSSESVKYQQFRLIHNKTELLSKITKPARQHTLSFCFICSVLLSDKSGHHPAALAVVFTKVNFQSSVFEHFSLVKLQWQGEYDRNKDGGIFLILWNRSENDISIWLCSPLVFISQTLPHLVIKDDTLGVSKCKRTNCWLFIEMTVEAVKTRKRKSSRQTTVLFKPLLWSYCVYHLLKSTKQLTQQLYCDTWAAVYSTGWTFHE